MKKIPSFLFIVLFLLIFPVQPAFFAEEKTVAEHQYETGMEYFEEGDYERAFSYFQISGEVKKYAPAQYMLGVCYRDGLGVERNQNEAEKYFSLAAAQGYSGQESRGNGSLFNNGFSDLQVGDIVYFGSYEQDHDYTNGKEPIEWLVLDVQDNKALLLSKNVLDDQQNDSDFQSFKWETSDIRKWLNEAFVKVSFTDEELAQIVKSVITADKNPYYEIIKQGNDTVDRVFLLSGVEAEKYFDSNIARQCYGTAEYCAVHGYTTNTELSWKLRTRGNEPTTITYVKSNGSISWTGNSTRRNNPALRPALWLSLEN